MIERILRAFGLQQIEPPFPEPRATLVYTKVGLSVVFDSRASTGRITRQRLGFGDNEISWDNPIIKHEYPAAGEYLVSLVVIDERGRASEYAKLISVREP